MQVFVQLGQTGADVPGFLSQVSDIIIQQLAYALKVSLLGVDIQRLTHLLIQIRQVIKGGCSIHGLKGKALKTHLCSILHDDPRPFFHTVTGYADALALTGGHARHQVLLLIRVFCHNLHDIQNALCDPEALHRCKGWLQFRSEVLNAQLWQGIRCQLIVHQQRADQHALHIHHRSSHVRPPYGGVACAAGWPHSFRFLSQLRAAAFQSFILVLPTIHPLASYRSTNLSASV